MRRPLRRRSARGIGKAGVVVFVIVFLVIGIYAGESGVLQRFGQYLSSGSNSNAQIGTTSSTNTPITPVSVTTIYNTYASNEAAGDSEYTGKTIYVSGSSGNVQQDQSGDYVSVGYPNVLFIWTSQAVASVVPTNSTAFIARCSVSGYQTPDSAPKVDGLLYLSNVLVLGNCSLVLTQIRYCANLLTGITITDGVYVEAAFTNHAEVSAIIHNSGNHSVNITSFGMSPIQQYVAYGNISEVVAPGSQRQVLGTTNSPIGGFYQPASTIYIQFSFAPTSSVNGFVWGGCQTYAPVVLTSFISSTTGYSVGSTTSASSTSQTAQYSVTVNSIAFYASYFGPNNTEENFLCSVASTANVPSDGASLTLTSHTATSVSIKSFPLDVQLSSTSITDFVFYPTGTCVIGGVNTNTGTMVLYFPSPVFYANHVQVSQSFGGRILLSDNSSMTYDGVFQ